MTTAMPLLPERIRRVVGALPPPGTLPASYPFETMAPHQQGYVETGGVKVWYGVFGESGPWLCFAPLNQIATATTFKANVPYLATQFRVLVMDLPGTGQSDRPASREAYRLNQYLAHFCAVLDHVCVDQTTLIAVSFNTLLALRFAAEQPARVSRLIIVGGVADSLATDAATQSAVAISFEQMRGEWPTHLDRFWSSLFTEPHSTKAFEDGVHFSCATNGEVVAMTRAGWLDHDVRGFASRVTCPTLVIHGDGDKRVPWAKGREIADLVPGATLLTIGGGGHLTMVRDPVAFNHAVRDFSQPPRVDRQWTRGMARKPKALFISSPIGLGHVQRDLAIAREMRKLRPELEIDWFTVDPAARYLLKEGERLHPLTARLANESRHFESVAGEHDLQAFFALRTMDEIMARNFMTFTDLIEAEHYDIVVGDEAWDVDYFYHENPELKRQPFVFLTDFVGCLPMSDDEREHYLCADRNADDIEHIARYPWIRDRSIFIGNPQDLPDQTFGAGLPQIREWTQKNFCFSGYALPFDPATLLDTDRLRAKHGYRRDEKLVIASIGGTAVGRPLLEKIAAAFPRMKKQIPELRLILVAGPRLAAEGLPSCDGMEVRPYVHHLFEHLACSDLALVQGGLSTCMELVATRKRFLSFPLERHFEQCIHVRHRLQNYCADCSVKFRDLLPDDLADRALAAMQAPIGYRAVETDGAMRAAQHIVQVLENRHWASG